MTLRKFVVDYLFSYMAIEVVNLADEVLFYGDVWALLYDRQVRHANSLLKKVVHNMKPVIRHDVVAVLQIVVE